MDPILIFLVLPIAIIILAIVLQRILKCSTLVALTFFAIFLILTFTVFGTDFLIFAILYTILAFIAAFLADLFCRIARRVRNWDDNNSCSCRSERNCNCDHANRFRSSERSGRSRNNGCGCSDCNDRDDANNGNLLTLTSACRNGESAELLAINSNGNCNNNGRNNCNGNNWSSNSWNSNNWNNNNCNCGNNSNNSESIVLSAEVVPNSTGRSGCFSGNFRRRCRF